MDGLADGQFHYVDRHTVSGRINYQTVGELVIERRLCHFLER